MIEYSRDGSTWHMVEKGPVALNMLRQIARFISKTGYKQQIAAGTVIALDFGTQGRTNFRISVPFRVEPSGRTVPCSITIANM